MLGALLMVLVALVLPLSACGGDDGDSASPATPAPSASEPRPERAGGSAGALDDGRDGDGSGSAGDGGSSADEDGSRAGSNAGAAGGERVDLSVDPGSIRGARVTPIGAVQTLPPNEDAQRTAQENSYSSIKSFGAEATGAEATNITFALVQYLTAKAEGDWATACARLYSVLRENVERSAGGQSCPEAYGSMMARVPSSSRAEQARIDVSSVRRGEGNRAFVIYKTPSTLSADMPMYVEGGVWTVGALEAYALTPEQAG